MDTKKYSTGLKFSNSADGYIVIGIGVCTDNNINIPDTYLDKPVIGIGKAAFKNCESLISIIIPDSIITIGKAAFENCKNLEKVIISNQVKMIDDYTFERCLNLKSVTLPRNIAIIGDGAFDECGNLEDIGFPNGLNVIGDHSFRGCSRLAHIKIPDSVTTICDYAFCRCTGISNIIIPKSVTNMGSFVFSWCKGITIYCETETQPLGWSVLWNNFDFPVVWGYTKTQDDSTINLNNIFDSKIDRIKPILYEEFQKIGWTEEQFLYYLLLLKRIHSCAILFPQRLEHNYFKNSISIELEKKLDEKKMEADKKAAVLKKTDVYYEDSIIERGILGKLINDLFDFLETFTVEKIDKREICYGWLEVLSQYITNIQCYLGNYIDYPYVSLVCSSFEDFRTWFEKYISKVLNKEAIINFIVEKDYYNYSIEELEELKEDINKEITMCNEPPLYSDINNYSLVQKWAREYSEYCDSMESMGNLENIDEVLEEKKSILFDNRKNILYIYSRNVICHNNNHSIESVKAYIRLSDEKEAILNIEYCHDCGEFFISEKGYNYYRTLYGFLPIYFRKTTVDGKFIKSKLNIRASESPLMLSGYNVNKQIGLSQSEREKRLATLINSGVLKKYEIIAYLEMFIAVNGAKNNMEEAVSKWEHDLKYVRKYKIDSQNEVEINEIRHK